MSSYRLLHQGLQVTFTWHQDRYHHQLAIPDGATLLQSIEGTSEEDWPASPAFQQATSESSPDGQKQLFLVGMAGKSHWSMSISAEPEGLVFDVACRVKEKPRALGSHYEWSSSDAQQKLRCKLVEIPKHTVVMSPETKRLTITPLIPQSLDLPATFRWKYVLTTQ